MNELTTSLNTDQSDLQAKIIFENRKLNLNISQSRGVDSDDDFLDTEQEQINFVPFDTSNDIPLNKTSQPAYLRDCLES